MRLLTLACIAAVLFGAFAPKAAGQAINPGFNEWTEGTFASIPFDSLGGFDSPNRLLTALSVLNVDHTVMPLSSRPDLGIAPAEGMDAVVLETKAVNLLGLLVQNFPGAISTQRFAIDILGNEFVRIGGGQPIADRISRFEGVYLYNPVPGDTFYAEAILTRNGVEIGRGSYQSGEPRSNWTPFAIDIAYSSPLDPDSIDLFITASKPANLTAFPASAGSLAVVDGFGIPCDSSRAPANPRTESVSGGIELSWDPIPSTAGCKLKVVPDGGTPIYKFRPAGISTTFVPDAMLIPSTDYLWSVQCACRFSPLVLTPESAPQLFLGRSGAPAAQSLHAYPNPAVDQVRVPALEIGSTVHMVDLLGRELAQRRVGHQGFVDLQGLPPGMLVLIGEGGHAVVEHRR